MENLDKTITGNKVTLYDLIKNNLEHQNNKNTDRYISIEK